jgi:hypothetical protein
MVSRKQILRFSSLFAEEVSYITAFIYIEYSLWPLSERLCYEIALQDRYYDTEKYNSETERCHDISVFHITASWYLNKRPIKILNLTKTIPTTLWSQKRRERTKKPVLIVHAHFKL